MPWAQAITQLVPSWRVIVMIGTILSTGFMAGVGVVAAFGGYSDLPTVVQGIEADQELMWVRVNNNALGLQEVRAGLVVATAERARILCLVRITAEGDVLSPLEVDRLCP